jgi:hypothetical protein
VEAGRDGAHGPARAKVGPASNTPREKGNR